jgi:hypothetical protein
VENLGKIIEAAEIEIRSNLENLHIPKCFRVVEGIRKEKRKPGGPMGNHATMLNQAVLARGIKK